MEDIDNIIINTLKHLNCPIDDETTSLKQFNHDLVIKALMSCIDVITPGTGIPHFLPSSMNQRLKLATNIADHIKELGFRGDIGYQMILYCNEVEIRRLLMFLIERLPRESDKSVHSEDSSRMSVLVKSIKQTLSKSLKTAWVPTEVLRNDIRRSQGLVIRVGYGNCYSLECKTLHIPNTRHNYTEELKKYCVHNLADVTKQCSYKNLIPSLLFNATNCMHPLNEKHVENILNINSNNIHQNISKPDESEINININIKDLQITSEAEKIPDILATLKREIETGDEEISSLKTQIKTLETKRLKLLETKQLKEKDLNTQLQNLDIKSKSHTLLSNKDNISKLENVVQNGTQKLVDLTSQWYAVQEPLLKQYRNIMETLNVNESEAQDLQERLQVTKQKCRKVNEELKEKDQLLVQLTEQYSKLSKQTNRSAYTRRILEIIANIKKQSNDIDKILEDTREVQKEINTLTGQLDRSFALADEVIFRDAKQDETARKSYKLLACMHNEYSQVIQASTELGAIIRESRNLQEQVDTEEAREISARLDRVMADLNQIRNETAALKQKK